jgi:hypothetical protein
MLGHEPGVYLNAIPKWTPSQNTLLRWQVGRCYTFSRGLLRAKNCR